jgi:hypothetical protein
MHKKDQLIYQRKSDPGVCDVKIATQNFFHRN